MSFQHHSNCDACGSSDALAVYDTHVHCFSCNFHSKPEGEYTPSESSSYPTDLISGGDYRSFRGISMETCKHFNYLIKTNSKGEAVHLAPYYNQQGQLQAQHLRYPDKRLPWRGDNKSALPMFGQHKVKAGGRKLIVCEGEIDCMSVSQAFGNKYPVVGIAGVQSSPKIFKEYIELLESFEEVVIAFDADDAGREYASKCADILSVGKAKIVILPNSKDMNDILLDEGVGKVTKYIWDAKPYSPDGIVLGVELKDKLKDWFSGEGRAQGLTIPRPKLNEMINGIRKGELTLLTAGTGIGKSTEANEILYYLEQVHDQKVGLIALEESTVKTSLRYISMQMNKPIHLLPVDDQGKPIGIDTEDFLDAYEKTIGNGKYALYDHFGALDSDNLMSKLRYLATGLDCDFILLDHVTIATSLEDDQNSAMDKLTNNLRSLIEQTGVGVIAICHLRKTSNQGKGFESGGEISLDDLKGSGSLKQISDTIIAMERDQQSKKPNIARTRVLKCRETGRTGLADVIEYSPDTGRINHIEGDFTDDDFTGEEEPDF